MRFFLSCDQDLWSTTLHYNVKVSNLMTWIFDDCPDTYGSCIRQYSLFGISLLVLILALYSCIKVFRQWNSFTFQLLPLTINTATAFILVGIYTQMEVYNIRIALLIIEIYSYFVLSYGFIYMVTRKNKGQGRRLRVVKNMFAIFTVVCFVAFFVVIFFSVFEIITCEEDQGTGSLILISLQVPLLFITCIYSRKSKSILINKPDQESARSYTNQEKLLNQQEQQKKVKLLQLKLIRLAFLVTFLLHIIQVVFFYIGQRDQQYTCQNNKVVVDNLLTLYILYIESFTQLFPHIMIPIIFWYLPLRYLKQAVTLYMSDDVRLYKGSPEERLEFAKNEQSKYIDGFKQEEKIRKKMNETKIHRALKRVETF